MTAMDHAAAHERIEDLLLEPTRLATLASSDVPADVALREHVADCPGCRADLAGWEWLQRQLVDALPRSPVAAGAAVEPAELPSSLRARVISQIRTTERSHGPIALARLRSRRAVATWVGLAASLIVLAGTGVITVDQVARRTVAEADARALSNALAAIDRVLADPGHRVVELRSPDGASGGSISWSSHDLVVLSTTLPPPGPDQRYRCWLEEDGRSVLVGWMWFTGSTAHWVGTLDEWATFEIGPDTRFVVTLEDAASQVRAGPTFLSADLGS